MPFVCIDFVQVRYNNEGITHVIIIFTEVNDLHKFVSVALHTAAGEGDLSSDRLSHLKMVGSGFGPLIYGLIADSSFESFRQKCKDVWTAVEQAPTLPIFMVWCIFIILMVYF